jgi:hypothetical protein
MPTFRHPPFSLNMNDIRGTRSTRDCCADKSTDCRSRQNLYRITELCKNRVLFIRTWNIFPVTCEMCRVTLRVLLCESVINWTMSNNYADLKVRTVYGKRIMNSEYFKRLLEGQHASKVFIIVIRNFFTIFRIRILHKNSRIRMHTQISKSRKMCPFCKTCVGETNTEQFWKAVSEIIRV